MNFLALSFSYSTFALPKNPKTLKGLSQNEKGTIGKIKQVCVKRTFLI